MLSDTERARARRRLQEATIRLQDHEARLVGRGLTPAEIKRALDPLRSLSLQLREEVEVYERGHREG